MRKFIVTLSSIASLFAVSCQKANNNVVVSTITATVEQHEMPTKTALEGTSVLWCSGDEILVFTDSNNKVRYTTSESGTRAKFTSTAQVVGNPQYALYPYQSNANINGTNITFTIPSTQKYVEKSFGKGANVAVGKFDGDVVVFKNACGVLRLSLSVDEDHTAKVGKIELTDPSYNLAGSFTANAENDFTAECTTGTNMITLDCGDGVTLSPSATSFNIVVPAGALKNGFTARVYSTHNRLITTLSTDKNNALTRTKIVSMPNKEIKWIGAGCEEKEYLQNKTANFDATNLSTSGPYINTGVEIRDTDYGFNIRYKATDEGDHFQNGIVYIHSSSPFDYTRFLTGTISSPLGVYVGFGIGISGVSTQVSHEAIDNVSLNYKNDKTAKINGLVQAQNISSINFGKYSEYAESIEFTLMGTHSIYPDVNKEKVRCGTQKLYDAELTKGTDIIHKYVPCVKDNIAGLYDVIGCEFLSNAGPVGTFTTSN